MRIEIKKNKKTSCCRPWGSHVGKLEPPHASGDQQLTMTKSVAKNWHPNQRGQVIPSDWHSQYGAAAFTLWSKFYLWHLYWPNGTYALMMSWKMWHKLEHFLYWLLGVVENMSYSGTLDLLLDDCTQLLQSLCTCTPKMMKVNLLYYRSLIVIFCSSIKIYIYI